MRSVPLFLLLLLPSWVAAAPSPSADGTSTSGDAAAVREAVEASLMDYESVPGKEELLALSSRVDAVLRDIVERPSPRALARVRAVAVLRYFPSAATVATLRRVIERSARATAGSAVLELQAALSAYALTAGPSAVPLLRPFLAHANVDLRELAASALALTRSPAVRPLLERRLGVELSPMVRRRLQRELGRLGR